MGNFCVRKPPFPPRVVSAFQGSSRCYRLFGACATSFHQMYYGARNLCVVHVSSKWDSWSKEIVESFPDSLVHFSLYVSFGSAFHTSLRTRHCTAYAGHRGVSALKSTFEPSPGGSCQIRPEATAIHPSVGRVIASDACSDHFLSIFCSGCALSGICLMRL